MRAEFPVIEQLAGPDFLGPETGGTPYAYFADVAALEWAYQTVLTAQERSAVDVRELSADRHALLAQFATGATLGAAHAAVASASAHFDLLAALQELLGLGVFCAITVEKTAAT